MKVLIEDATIVYSNRYFKGPTLANRSVMVCCLSEHSRLTELPFLRHEADEHVRSCTLILAFQLLENCSWGRLWMSTLFSMLEASS